MSASKSTTTKKPAATRTPSKPKEQIPIDSLAAVMARTVSGVNHLENMPEHEAAMVITGLLREVDPLIDPDHISHLASHKGSDDGR